jgi:hypothetical protein
MTPFAELIDPFDVRTREWVIALDAPGIHTIVRRRLFLRSLQSGTYQPAGGLPTIPPGTTRAVPQAQLYQLLESEPLERLRGPTFVRGSLLDDLLGEFVEAHRTEVIPLEEALRLLAGVTHTMMLEPKSDKKLAKTAAKVTYVDVLMTVGPGLKAQRKRWKDQLLRFQKRDCQLLEDDEVIKQELAQLTSQGQEMRFALRALVGHDGRLSLGPWSCTLGKHEWNRLWHNPRWRSNTPSEWAEELLGASRRCSTRAIKEQLARERKERKIEAAWAAYGLWLSNQPQALRDLEYLLGGLPIQLRTSDAGI